MYFIKRAQLFLFMSVLLLLLPGCFARLVGVLAADEIILLRTAGIRASATGLVLESHTALATQLARTRILRSVSGRQLYVMENGKRQVFADLLNSNTIRWTRSGHVHGLPGHLYTLRRGIGKANIRLGPGKHFEVFKTIGADELVIILEEQNGWLKVLLDENVFGWISAAIVLAASDDEEEEHKSSSSKVVNEEPESPTGSKQSFRTIKCPNCEGQGRSNCYQCSGSGRNNCSDCSARGKISCSDCDRGKIQCTDCNSTGRHLCSSCKGEKVLQCHSCRGYGYTLDQYRRKYRCSDCQGKGRYDCGDCSNGYWRCNSCNGNGHYRCNSCSGRGHYNCMTCSGKGTYKCFTCNGQKLNSRCYDCMGEGTISILAATKRRSLLCEVANLGAFDLYSAFYLPVFVKLYENNRAKMPIHSSTIQAKSTLSFYNLKAGSYIIEIYMDGAYVSEQLFSILPCSNEVVSIGGKEFKL